MHTYRVHAVRVFYIHRCIGKRSIALQIVIFKHVQRAARSGKIIHTTTLVQIDRSVRKAFSEIDLFFLGFFSLGRGGLLGHFNDNIVIVLVV